MQHDEGRDSAVGIGARYGLDGQEVGWGLGLD